MPELASSSNPAIPAPAPPGAQLASPLVPVVAAAAGGIVVDRSFGELLPAEAARPTCTGWWLAGVVALALWWWLHGRERASASGLALLIGVACLAGCWHHWHWSNFAACDLGRFASDDAQPCCIEAVVVASPERVAAPPPSPYRAIPQSEKSQLPLRVVRLRNGEQWIESSGKCELIVDGHLLGVAANDRVRVFGQLRRPTPARNPGQFDFSLHARADRQLCALRARAPECVSVIRPSGHWSPRRWIDDVRQAWQARLWTALGPERAPMAAAILTGTRNSMPREQTEVFRRTGAMHVLVVSGLHAGVLVTLVYAGLGTGLLPRPLALSLAMLTVAAYVLLTGAHPPVVRAGVLAELGCLALWFRRNPFAINSLAFAALVVLALNPADLFRSGPQLSFLCIAVLLWFGSVRWRRPPSPLETLLFRSAPWYSRLATTAGRKLALMVAATLAVWVVSLPLVMHQFHLVTPVAVVSAPLVFFALTCTLISGFAMLWFAWLMPASEGPLAQLCRLSVGSLEGVVEYASQLPMAYFWTPSPPSWWVLGWYGLAAILLRPGGTLLGWRRSTQAIALWVVAGAVPVAAQRAQPEPPRVAFLDVGHGVCTVITTPEGYTLLYDAGSLGSPSFATETIAGYLWSRGIRTIDGVVLSHPDVDHFNALPGLVDRFAVRRVFVSPHMFFRRTDPDDTSAPAELRRLLDRRGVAIEQIELGDRLPLGRGTQATVLFPDRLGVIGSDNANSVVLAVESGRQRILLPGDLESPGIDVVMADEPYDCHILLAPHHGSRGSDPPGFAAWSQPEFVVVSGSSVTARGDLTASYGSRGTRLLLTREVGAIEFRLAEPMEIQQFCAE